MDFFETTILSLLPGTSSEQKLQALRRLMELSGADTVLNSYVPCTTCVYKDSGKLECAVCTKEYNEYKQK